MAHSLVRLLRARDEHCEIHLLAPSATVPLARRMDGVAGSFTIRAGHGEIALRHRYQLGVSLREQGFDQAIVLPNSFKSALVPLWARIPRRTGWRGEARLGVLNDRRVLSEKQYPLMVERFMALALDPGDKLEDTDLRPCLSTDSDNALRLCARLDLDPDGATVICPGAQYGPAKRWPTESFAAVARHVTAAGGKVWLMGSAADAGICEEIASLVPAGVVNLAGRTSLLDAVDLLGLAHQVICNDSGLMHVACAVGRHVVAIYGSTSPEFTPPLSRGAAVVRLGLACSPCFERNCPLGHLDCLRRLPPARVIDQMVPQRS